MAYVSGTRKCGLCGRWISKNGLAWASHRRACARRNGQWPNK